MMKKSQLRQIIKEEILKESTPGFDTRNSGGPLPTLESVKEAYEAKNLKKLEVYLQELANEGVIHSDVRDEILYLVKKIIK
jgi:hypothetical protein